MSGFKSISALLSYSCSCLICFITHILPSINLFSCLECTICHFCAFRIYFDWYGSTILGTELGSGSFCLCGWVLYNRNNWSNRNTRVFCSTRTKHKCGNYSKKNESFFHRLIEWENKKGIFIRKWNMGPREQSPHKEKFIFKVFLVYSRKT